MIRPRKEPQSRMVSVALEDKGRVMTWTCHGCGEANRKRTAYYPRIGDAVYCDSCNNYSMVKEVLE